MKHRHPGKYRSKTPKGRITYKKRPSHNISTINKEKRTLFTYLNRKPYETGGYLDFNKKGLEQVNMYYGKSASVDIPIDPDWEVDFHTHPPDNNKVDNKLNNFPSKWDINTMKDYPTQASLVFHNDNTMVATKKDNFKIKKKILDKIYKDMEKDAVKLNTDKLFKKYKPEYNKLGIDMNYIKRDKAVKIPITVIEPTKNTRKLTKKNWEEGGDWDIEADADVAEGEREERAIARGLAEREVW